MAIFGTGPVPENSREAVDANADRYAAKIVDLVQEERRKVWLEAAEWVLGQADGAIERYAGDLPDTVLIDIAARLRALAEGKE